ncbi:hypothetical protein [Burkholderia cepacia]|uniref:hypothetical protein n=1 Tax=Burkholderia cepacia TaxID=292 RepID=UPI00042091AE|nr:hypothetical protein [Burkholderia cepacia]AIO28453.1 hypothetical protein DM41_6162 [Burkholderia cepacia ATCC 25416]ASE97828.1 hypothetical protein CEQ23_30865 [Burkholderia cepacia]MCA8464304.1 hypothetical protein [Burkholderia cepacia]MDN7761126.1 hypothetical protein [Burkholderia cepacia]QCY06867.1 hypothetical protein EJ998_28185 [Burkholderia cepacia ATCC 25416]
MGTAKERERLEHEIALAERDVELAEAAVKRSMRGDRPPNESAFTCLEVARAKLDALKRALADCKS